MRFSRHGGAGDLIFGGVLHAVGDVLGNGPVEEEDILADKRDPLTQIRVVEGPDVMITDRDGTRVRVIEAEKQLDDRCLSRPRRPDECRRLGGLDLETHVRKDGKPIRVAETDIVEHDPAAGLLSGQGLVAVDDGRLGIEDVEDPSGRCHGPLIEIDGLTEGGQRPEESLGEEDHYRIQTDVQRALESEKATPHEYRRESGEDRHPDQR